MSEQGSARDETLTERAEELVENVSEELEALRERARDLEAQVRSFAREHPIASIAIAAAAGFAIGRIAARFR